MIVDQSRGKGSFELGAFALQANALNTLRVHDDHDGPGVAQGGPRATSLLVPPTASSGRTVGPGRQRAPVGLGS
jgi:hypothetical protein